MDLLLRRRMLLKPTLVVEDYDKTILYQNFNPHGTGFSKNVAIQDFGLRNDATFFMDVDFSYSRDRQNIIRIATDVTVEKSSEEVTPLFWISVYADSLEIQLEWMSNGRRYSKKTFYKKLDDAGGKLPLGNVKFALNYNNIICCGEDLSNTIPPSLIIGWFNQGLKELSIGSEFTKKGHTEHSTMDYNEISIIHQKLDLEEMIKLTQV